MEKVWCMFSNDGLGKDFWVEAVNYACHLVNRLPSSTLNEKCPLEVWSGKPITDYDSLHVFGCPAYYYVRDSKLKTRAKKGVSWALAWKCRDTEFGGWKYRRLEWAEMSYLKSLLCWSNVRRKICRIWGEEMTIPQAVEIVGVKSQVETFIAADGSDNGEG